MSGDRIAALVVGILSIAAGVAELLVIWWRDGKQAPSARPRR